MGKTISAKVIGTVGSHAKIATAKVNGCDEVLSYHEEDVPSDDAHTLAIIA